MNPVPYSLKRKCVDAWLDGKPLEEIFRDHYHPAQPNASMESFFRMMRKWKKGQMADPASEHSGTYPGMVAHAATVQVNAAGIISQAWIKQKVEDYDWDEIIKHLREAVPVIPVKHPVEDPEEALLEIPLFDLHFGVATYHDYIGVLDEILDRIRSRVWKEIHVIIGQDCLHNNDMRGHTAKGTPIESVDIPSAWRDAWMFWSAILCVAEEQSLRVVAHYSRGNHDECLSWAFFKALEAAFPDMEFDDSLDCWKCFSWKKVFVGFGHLEYTNDANKILRDFVMDFAKDFASAECREIHAGHLHRESVDAGVVVRRLASAVPTDEWSKANGFTGAHKRFQLFEYVPGRLHAVYYL